METIFFPFPLKRQAFWHQDYKNVCTYLNKILSNKSFRKPASKQKFQCCQLAWFDMVERSTMHFLD